MRASRFVLTGVALLVVASGIVLPKALAPSHSKSKEGSSHEKSEGHKKEVPRVTTVTLRPSELTEAVASTGSLLADEGVELQAETDGKVIAILFTEGARVRKGELLIKLNDEDLVAARARGQYRRELASLRERRVAQLLKQGVARQEEYDTALNELNVQGAEIALTDAQIRKTEIRAPFDGVVGLRYVSEGSYVNAATRIATLQRLDRIKLDFSLPEKYAARLRVGNPVVFTVSGSDRQHQARIYALDPRIDAATRTVTIRAVAENTERRLLPGAFASVHVTLASLTNALLVPSIALIPGLSETSVFVVQDGKAERRAVEAGTRTENTVHVLGGLKAGDVVITSGLQQLRAGQSVIVMDPTST
jgi:membrane fusion protein (multidrug efflux system)